MVFVVILLCYELLIRELLPEATLIGSKWSIRPHITGGMWASAPYCTGLTLPLSVWAMNERGQLTLRNIRINLNGTRFEV